MEEFVYNQLSVFKDLTLRLIDAVNFGDTNIVLDLLDERQVILNELEGCEHDVFMKCVNDLEIAQMDSLLESLMQNKISDVYSEIKSVGLERKTINAYNNGNSGDYSAFIYRV